MGLTHVPLCCQNTVALKTSVLVEFCFDWSYFVALRMCTNILEKITVVQSKLNVK